MTPNLSWQTVEEVAVRRNSEQYTPFAGHDCFVINERHSVNRRAGFTPRGA